MYQYAMGRESLISFYPTPVCQMKGKIHRARKPKTFLMRQEKGTPKWSWDVTMTDVTSNSKGRDTNKKLE